MKWIILLSVVLETVVTAATPSEYELSLVGGAVFPEDETQLDNQMVVGGEFQYNTDFFLQPELQFLQSLNTDFTKSDSKKDATYLTRIGLNAVYDFKSKSGQVPFLKAGIGYETLTNHDYENDNAAYLNAGAGIKYFLTKSVALKAEALYMQKLNDPYYDMNFGMLGGITIAFGGGEAAEPAAQPKPTVQPKPVPRTADIDHDGIFDASDKCPDTPQGVVIDARGCPVDSDGDGIADYEDSCPDTPPGIATGAKGCPLDSDGDGIADDKDRCPDTSAGVLVNAEGCPLDRDGDGIPNKMDRCPNTPKGAMVDLKGCESTPVIQTWFKNNSMNISATEMEKIKTYAQYLKQNGFGVMVIGYTDSKGSKAYNQKLSEKRAAFVAKIIEVEGVPAKLIQVVGKGEADPIADNSLAEGRAKNRRVELKRLP